VVQWLTEPLLRLGFARRDAGWLVFQPSRKLSATQRTELLRLLSTAETYLSREPQMRIVGRTIDAALTVGIPRTVDRDQFIRDRREILERFRIASE
jgi:hypothetical protein